MSLIRRSGTPRSRSGPLDVHRLASVSCSQTYATLRLFQDGLDPAVVTVALGIQPTESGRKGERVRLSRAPLTDGFWSYSTEHLKSTSIEVHLDHLLALLEPVRAELAAFRDAGVSQDVFCFWATEDGQGGPGLAVAQMRGLAEHELPISFDCYDFSDPDGP